MALNLKPSNAHLWGQCPAWATMDIRYGHRQPGKDDLARREGLVAHKVAAQYAKYGAPEIPEDSWAGKVIDGTVVTPAMVRAAEEYAEGFGGEHCGIEYPIDIMLYQGLTLKGYVDSWQYYPDRRHLAVREFKWGVTPVYAKGNYQCALYADGIMAQNKHHVVTVEIQIYQPNRFDGRPKLDAHTYAAGEIADIVGHLSKRAYSANSGDPDCITGAHCHYCPGVGACDAYHQLAYPIVAALRDREPEPADLGAELRWLEGALETIKTRYKGLEQLALSRTDHIPGYERYQGLSNRVWIDAKIAHEIGRLMGIDLTGPTVTPAQAIKLGMQEDLIDNLTERNPGKMRLKPVNIDKQFKEVFGNGKPTIS